MSYKHIEDISENFTGEAHLIKLPDDHNVKNYDEDKVNTDYFIVSATTIEGRYDETYVFPSNSNGEIIDWVELPGSQKKIYDCEKVAEDFAERFTESSAREVESIESLENNVNEFYDKIHCENCGNAHNEEVEECEECGSLRLFTTSEAVEFFEGLSKTFENWSEEFSEQNGGDDYE